MTMHVIGAERGEFEQYWAQDVPVLALANPCGIVVGDTIKLCETVAGIATGRAVFSTVTAIRDVGRLRNVSQTVFQRTQQ